MFESARNAPPQGRAGVIHFANHPKIGGKGTIHTMIQLRPAARFASRVLSAAVFAALLAGSLFAQSDAGGYGPPSGSGPPDGMDAPTTQRGPSVERDLKRLTKLLTLSTDQQTQVKAILTDRNQKIGELMKASRPGNGQSDTSAQQEGPPSSEQFEQLRAQTKAIRDDANTKIAATLTADQAAKFSAWLKQQKQRSGSDDMPPPPPDGGEGGPPPDGGGGPGGGGPSGGGPPSL
jgi:Spy/CpxP family protein refolding chaperone